MLSIVRKSFRHGTGLFRKDCLGPCRTAKTMKRLTERQIRYAVDRCGRDGASTAGIAAGLHRNHQFFTVLRIKFDHPDQSGGMPGGTHEKQIPAHDSHHAPDTPEDARAEVFAQQVKAYVLRTPACDHAGIEAARVKEPRFLCALAWGVM